ncbi:MAG: WG repeat-containing protein [Agathobacter sp.]|nr:WG repeat-containing protein [Agathobacter sp.]
MKKRVLCVILVSILMLSGCGKSNDQKQVNEVRLKNTEKAVSNQNTEKASVSETDNISKTGNGSAIFSTNYKIEDYCNGDFIVSKSDGLLYGVINIQGKEIIPVQFDNISFMNDEKVVNGDSKNLYIKAQYEDQYFIYNENGEKIMDGDASIINYKLGGGEVGENNPFFEIGDYGTKKDVYSKAGQFLFDIPLNSDANSSSIVWISPELYLLSESVAEKSGYTINVSFLDTILMNANGETLQKWDGSAMANDGCEDNNYWFFLGDNEGKYSKITISATGELVSQENGLEQSDAAKEAVSSVMSSSDKIYLGKDNENVLYTTNNTWKYEDSSGNPVYDDRYFSMGQEENCYFLSNSDNQVCVITKNGKKTVDYGTISLQGDNYTYNGILLGDGNAYADYDSFCYIDESNGENTVYYYESK